MGDTGGFGNTTLKCRADQVLLHFIVTGDADPPALTADPDGLVTSLTDTAAGQITVNLKHRYAAIYPWGNMQDASGEYTVGVVPSASLTADNTLLISTFDTDAAGALGDSAAPINVFMLCTLAGDLT